jgi:hypothetical protein
MWGPCVAPKQAGAVRVSPGTLTTARAQLKVQMSTEALTTGLAHLTESEHAVLPIVV